MKSDNQTVEFIVRAQQVFKGKLIGLRRFIARSTFPSFFSFVFAFCLPESLDSFLAPSLYRYKVVLIRAFRYRFIQSKCK